MSKTKRIILVGLLASSGLVLSIIETMIPMTTLVPGAKLGLANITNIIGMVLINISAGFQILLFRIIVGSLLTGTFMTITFFMSFFGGLTGYLVMALIYYFFKNKFSIIGISIFGAVFHNVGQVITAYFIIDSRAIFYYLPYLVLLAVPTGMGIGFIAYFSLKYLRAIQLKRD